MCDRPATECEDDAKDIEITPEMIEAAKSVIVCNSLWLERYDDSFYNDIVRDAILAALNAR